MAVLALFSMFTAAACGCSAPGYVAVSALAMVGAEYPDVCRRSPNNAVDFDGQLWALPSASSQAPADALNACVRATAAAAVRPPVLSATLTLINSTQVRWSNGSVSALLLSVGRTEREVCL
jgi:hypothetical protein